MLHRLLVPLIAILLPTLASAQSASLTANTASYAPEGGTVTFTANVIYPTGATPSSIGWEIKLPAAWKFVGQTLPASAATAASPAVDDNTLEWAFSGFPPTQLQFSFTVSYPAGLSGDQTTSVLLCNYRSPSTNLTVAPVVLTPAPTAPSFTLNPVAQTATVGGEATFSVAAVGFPAPTLQWRKNGTAVAGATAATLTLTNVQAADAASYDAVATNTAGSTPSGAAALTVNKATPVLNWATPAAIVYGTALGNAQLNATVAGGVAGTFAYTPAAGARPGAGSPTLSVTFTPTDAANYNPATATVTLSVSPAPLTITASADAKVYGTARSFGPGATGFTATGLAPGDAITSVTLAASGGGAATDNAGNYTLTPSAPVGAAFNAANYSVSFVTGTLTVTPKPLTITANNDTKVAGETRTYGAGSTAFTSSGLVSPQTIGSVTVTANGGAAAGDAPGTYTLTPSAATGGTFNAANYAITYAPGTLTVNASLLAATLTPAVSTYSAAGGNLTLTARMVYPAANSTPSAIAWNIQLPAGWKFVSQILPAGATTAAAPQVNDNTLEWAFSSFPSTQLEYSFVVSSPAGLSGDQTITVTGAQYRSPTTNLTVAPVVIAPAPTAPSFTLNPVAQTATVGDNVTFTAAAVGFPAPTLQWRKNGTPVAGATAATLTLNAITSANGGTYDVVATNSAGTANSSGALLTVNRASQTVTFGSLAARTFGDPDTTLMGSSSAGLAVAYASSNTAVATIVGGNTLRVVGAGSATITASQAGNDDYTAAALVPQSLVVGKASANVSIGGLAQTYTGAARAASAVTTPSGLPVVFTYAGGATAPTDAGTYAVTATIDHPNYQGTASGSLVVAKAAQTVNFAALSTKLFSDGSTALVAPSTSGLPVSFASANTAVATVSGNVATFVSVGTTDITATQPGNANYEAATPVTRTLTVSPALQSITFAALAARTYAPADSFTLSATSSSGLQVSFVSSDPAVATVSGTTVTITGAGNATITASQAGNVNYGPADPVARTLAVAKANASVTLGNLAATYDGAAKPASALTSPAGLNLVVSYGAPPSSATPPTNAGTYPVTASVQEANYTGSATGNLVISKATQTLSFAPVSSPRLIDSGPVILSASASSGGNITFTSSNTAVATISGNSVILTGVGNTTLTARQAGDANYNAASDATQTLVVHPVAPQILRAPATAPTAIQGSPFYFGPFALNALSSPATFTASGRPAGVTIDALTGELSGTPTQTGTFTLVVTATNVTGNDSRTYSLLVQPPAPVITSPAAAAAVAGTAFSYTTVTVPPTGITFTATGLPTGWALSAAGVLTGTPTSAAPITATITASNATGAAVLPLVITPTLPPNAPAYAGPAAVAGTVGEALNFTANFGTGTTVYAVTAGSLPPGLSLSSGTGAVTGTPTTTGVFTPTLSATRSGLVALAEISFQINPPATAPVVAVTGGNVRAGTVGTALGPIALTASPAATSFTIGTLPAGLSVGGTPTAPSISGIPTLPGVFNVALTASNAAGAGPVTVLALSIDPHPQAPRINSSAIVAGRVGQALSYQLTSLPAGAATYSAASTLPTGLTLATATGQVTGTPAPEALGTRKVYFTGTNTFGTGPGLEVTFQTDPPLTVPVITSSGTAVAEVGKAFNYQITATNTPLSFTAEGLPTGLTLAAGGLISGVPASATGGTPLAITLRGANGDGTGDPKTLLLTILPPAATPVITSAIEVNARAGSAFSYQITATDSPTSFVASPLPAGLNLNPTSGLISGTPTNAGTARLGLQAANAQGLGAVAGLTIDVAAATATPAVTSAATVSGQVGATLDYQVTGAPGPLTAYRLEGTLPAGLSFNSVSGRLSGSPTTAGQSTVRLFVRNASGEGFPQDLLVNILPSPAVPVITSAGQLDARVGVAVNYQITATNPPHTALEAFDLPAGLAVNPNTGLIEGTPRSALTPVVQARLVGTNASGSGPARTLEIRIEPSLTAPVITNSPSTPAKVGQALSFQISATNSPTGFELREAPAWMTLDATAGRLGGTPTAPVDARVTLLARNAAGESGPFALLVEVNPVDGAPAFTGSRTLYGTAGTALTAYRLSASNTPTSFLVVGLPEGLAVTRRTEGAVNIWEITGTPRRAGRFLLEVTPANAAGVGKTVLLTLEITGHISFGS